MTQLDIEERREEGLTVLSVSGPVNSYTYGDFQEKLGKALSRGDVVVDLEKVSTLSSAGIGVLMASLDDAEAEGKRLRLLKPSEIVLLALDSTGFAERFPIIKSLKEL